MEAEPSLFELVRYLHLTPRRAGGVPTLPALTRYGGLWFKGSWLHEVNGKRAVQTA